MIIFLTIAAVLTLLVLLIAWICFRIAFYVPPKSKMLKEEFPIPEGEVYEPFRKQMIAWMKEIRAMPHEDVQIRSFDGLTLRGTYYEYAPGAPVELMFHGYRGSGERDLCGGVQRCFALGRSALVVEQRASIRSDGNVITFGIKESRDCRDWIDFAIHHLGPDVKIILTGISMGASTVLIAAGRELPKNVIGVLADCGFSSAEDIIKEVIRQMGLPADLAYPFVRLGAKLFGHFDPNETSPMEAVKNCRLPVIFFHGEDDDYVPCRMSRMVYGNCPTPKMLYTVPGAGHGLSYLVDPEGYLNALREFAPNWNL